MHTIRPNLKFKLTHCPSGSTGSTGEGSTASTVRRARQPRRRSTGAKASRRAVGGRWRAFRSRGLDGQHSRRSTAGAGGPLRAGARAKAATSKQTLTDSFLFVAFLDTLAQLGINPIGPIHRGSRADRLGVFGRYRRHKRDATIGQSQRSVPPCVGRTPPRLPVIFATRYPSPFRSKLFQIDHAHERALMIDRRSPAASKALVPHVAFAL